MVHPRYSSEEIARRGRELYDERIRQEVEPEHIGKFLAIDVETGSYEIAADHLTASNRAAAKQPGAPLFTMRIGYPALGRIGGRQAISRP